MRIIAGLYKGRKLDFIKSESIRPTMDRVKESLFNVLGEIVEGAEVLDLFAGSGSLGLEALSRGAKRAVFIDTHPTTVRLIKKNCETLGLGVDQYGVFLLDARDAIRRLERRKETMGIVFVDPPYGRWSLLENALMVLGGSAIVTDETIIAVEHSASTNPGRGLTGFIRFRELEFGETKVSLYRKKHEKA